MILVPSPSPLWTEMKRLPPPESGPGFSIVVEKSPPLIEEETSSFELPSHTLPSSMGSPRGYRQIELGEITADQLLKIDPERSGNYVQLLNLYGEAGLWDKAAVLRMLMKERMIKKSPGCSWIEVRDKVDLFFSGYSSSPRIVEIHATLKSLRRIIVNNEVSLEGVIS
ncbi:hypothetical protein MRB53_034616 [Persea americana]|uniref:Uncharacterized protein n=1 Tax=Persea americana TaxID=3435 RepID=A0ACC2K2D3_PERAE|nr:hypothetical protein MRB53_034616 [Persea americana]